MVTQYDITMGNDIAKDAHYEIIMGNEIARDIHCDVTMSNDVATSTYHDITMHNDVAMNFFYYVFYALGPTMILLWVVWNKNKNNFMFDQSWLEKTNLWFCVWLHKHNSCVRPRLIKHSLLLDIA